MNDQEQERMLEEFEQIREACTKAPGPKGDDFPGWNGETVESLPEFFNGTALSMSLNPGANEKIEL